MASVQQALEKMKPQFAMALPSRLKPETMIRVALTAVQNVPKLLECDRNSSYLAVLRAAQLGLEPDAILGQAYLIPYGKQVQLIPGYKGLIDRAINGLPCVSVTRAGGNGAILTTFGASGGS